MKTAIELADAIDNSEETTGFERRCASMLRTLSQENEALKADAARYRWLRTNSKSWSWTPIQYNIDIVSGFAAGGTGYLGHSFEDAINIAAMKGKS